MLCFLGDEDVFRAEDTPPSEIPDTFPSPLLQTFTELHKFCERIVYVPGNRDIPKLFEPNLPELPPYVDILHNKLVYLPCGLWLAGLGGCADGASLNGYVIPTYPSSYEDDCLSLFSKLKSLSKSDTSPSSCDQNVPPQVLLLTHTGMSASPLTVQSLRHPLHCTGSVLLSSLILRAKPLKRHSSSQDSSEKQINKTSSSLPPTQSHHSDSPNTNDSTTTTNNNDIDIDNTNTPTTTTTTPPSSPS